VILGLLVAAAARSPAAVADNSEMASSGTPKVAFTIGHLPKAGPYVAALRLVGLDVEVFTPHNPPAALDGYAGLVLGGGGDVDPAYYGEIAAGTRNPNPKRDEMELELFRLARKRDLAVLGICRGLQLMNVACGGTLHQDIGTGHSEVRHAVSVPPGSKLHGVVGNENFEIVGIVEAIEDAARRFVIGVQWHPEDNIDSREDQALFRSFARAAGVAGD
jgi:putative glutamine amidotransferase